MRLRMLSVGRSMSLKSLQFEEQKDLQTLLAYQAYLFNKNYGGAENDADIYAGLYNLHGNMALPTIKLLKAISVKSRVLPLYLEERILYIRF